MKIVKLLKPNLKLNLSLLFFLSFISLSYSQTTYFVKEVENIRDLSIRFCFDSNGKVDSIAVREDKTDYTDQKIIDEIIKQIRLVVVPDTGNVRNNCHEERFLFVNPTLQYCSLKPEEFKQLEKFKSGKFKYLSASNDSALITRTGNEQLETYANEFMRFEIVWVEPNIYTLKLVEVAMKGTIIDKGETIAVEIIKIIDPDTYVYRSLLLGVEIYGIIRKVE